MDNSLEIAATAYQVTPGQRQQRGRKLSNVSALIARHGVARPGRTVAGGNHAERSRQTRPGWGGRSNRYRRSTPARPSGVAADPPPRFTSRANSSGLNTSLDGVEKLRRESSRSAAAPVRPSRHSCPAGVGDAVVQAPLVRPRQQPLPIGSTRRSVRSLRPVMRQPPTRVA